MVKYCQECGNASYDSAPVCGNCGAKLPPKSEANSRPPKLDDKFKPGVITSTNDSIFSGSSSSFGKGLSSKLGSFDLSKFSSVSREKEQKSHAQAQKSAKPSFSKTATEGFKQKDKGIKDPAKKFSSAKTEKITREIKKESPKEEKVKKSIPKKEKKAEPKVTEKSSGGSSINIRKIAIVAILAIIILLIAGIGINGLQNQTTDEVKTYSDGIISFNYSGNWSMYNNTDGNSNSSDIAFKTKDNTLIGFTTIQSDDITYDKIISDINATSQSLNGEVLDAETYEVGGIPSLRMTISTADQGYSRYYCILRDGVYYSFVINNGKSSNKDISALNTTEIQNMINSISFQTTEIDAADGAEIA